ncbi:hypothetical protein SEA_FIZZLES_42 [Microbacterium phage Fizzles]|nr:hypothetical protein SEA_FIZZLES_42 [Microbacterium phage Fizzles]
MDWLIAMMAAYRVLAEVGGGGGSEPSLTIDLLDLQWWQILVGILGVLGFSPAPWILGLATNKIQFTVTADANYEKRAQEMRDNYDALVAEKDARYHDLDARFQKVEQAAATDRQTVSTVSAALAESTDLGKMAIHVIDEMRQAAQEVDPHVG